MFSLLIEVVDWELDIYISIYIFQGRERRMVVWGLLIYNAVPLRSSSM